MNFGNDLRALAHERVNYMLENFSPSESYQDAENKLIKLMEFVELKCGREVAAAVENLHIDQMDEFLDAAYRQGIADAFQLTLLPGRVLKNDE